jgi:hypothetical protein
LTVVFPLAPRRHFHWQFACAVAHVLQDLRIPREIIRSESAAIQVQPLARVRDPSLKATLNDLVFFCDLELCYHRDLRIVQLNLNHIPHQHRDPYVPIEAVHRLFETRLSHAMQRRSVDQCLRAPVPRQGGPTVIPARAGIQAATMERARAHMLARQPRLRFGRLDTATRQA